jgi:hypothetical protein
MAVETAPAPVQDTTILNTPPPAPPSTPESKLYPGTTAPTITPPAPPVTPPATTAPVVPPVSPSEPPKTPTETPKTEVPTTPPTAPTEIALTLPADSPLTPEDLALTLKEAKESGLTQDEAKEMLQSKDQIARSAQTRLKQFQEQAFEQQKASWKDAVAKDPEMGGDKLAETVALSSRAFKQLASPELQMWADKTGLGNFPEFVRLMTKVGRLMSEDRIVQGSQGSPPVDTSTADYKAEKLYGKTTPK